jgi:hypothetical protein
MTFNQGIKTLPQGVVSGANDPRISHSIPNQISEPDSVWFVKYHLR